MPVSASLVAVYKSLRSNGRGDPVYVLLLMRGVVGREMAIKMGQLQQSEGQRQAAAEATREGKATARAQRSKLQKAQGKM